MGGTQDVTAGGRLAAGPAYYGVQTVTLHCQLHCPVHCHICHAFRATRDEGNLFVLGLLALDHLLFVAKLVTLAGDKSNVC